MDEQNAPRGRPGRDCNAASHPVHAAEAAGRRLLAYLRLLPMTEERRLELTLEVLRDLAPGLPPHERTPARAMSLLRKRLCESGERAVPSAHANPVCLPLMRGHMVPEEMDRRPWLTQAARLAQGYAQLAESLSMLKPRVLLPMLLAVFILMHLLAPELS